MFGNLFAFARRTITQALVALRLTDSDWSAFHRLFSIPRIDYEILGGRFFEEILTHMVPSEPIVAVVDGVQVAPTLFSTDMPDTSARHRTPEGAAIEIYWRTVSYGKRPVVVGSSETIL